MSLTLRDAQHLSWKTFKKFESMNKKNTENIGTKEDLQKKANEVKEKLGPQEGMEKNKLEIERSISELLFSAFVFSERNKIDLEESFLRTVDDIILNFVS